MLVDDLTKLYPNMTYLCAPTGGRQVIRYIDIVEIPEGSAWTSPGDFIITTGYFIQSPDDFERLVTRLIDNHVVGLGIKIGKYVHDIPETVCELAEANRFPILSIPMEMSYRDIQKLSLYTRDSDAGAVQPAGRSDMVEFYTQVLQSGDYSMHEMKAFAERAGVHFRSDRLVFAAAMDPHSAQMAIEQLLLRPSPDFFLLYNENRQHLVGILTLRPGAPAEQGYLYGRQLFYAYCDPKYVLGASRISASAATLRKAYHQACFALKVGNVCSPRKPLHRYVDYMEYDFVYQNKDNDVLLSMVEEYLRPVLEYDEKKSAELLKTLYVVDECSYNMQQACAAIGIHRNTLYDRVRKVGKLLRHDLNAKPVRDAIHLALVHYVLMQMEKME